MEKGRSVHLHPMTGLDLDRVQVRRRIIETGNVGVIILRRQSPRLPLQLQRLRHRRRRRRQPL